MIYYVAPVHGTRIPLVYISICSLVGSMSVMAIKGFGVALKLTLAGNNQLTHPSTYVFGIVVVVCILVQMNYFNKALAIFSTNVYVHVISVKFMSYPLCSVNPTYFVTFSTSVIIASTILFQGFNTANTTTTVTLLAGFIVTFTGVHLLNISRVPDSPPLSSNHVPLSSSALENGVMYPRLSISGRMSHDGWPRTPSNGGHSRRGSLTTIFHVPERPTSLPFSEDDGAMRLERLREEEDEDADELTRLTGGKSGIAPRTRSPNGVASAETAPRIEAHT